MIVMDSSGWIEVLRGGPRAPVFRDRLDAASEVIVPAVVLYEVYKVTRRDVSEHEADRAAALLETYTVAQLITGDAHFQGLPEVEHVALEQG